MRLVDQGNAGRIVNAYFERETQALGAVAAWSAMAV